MEINEVRRGGQVKTAEAPRSKSGLSGAARPKSDRLALSQEVVAYLEERNRQLMERVEEKNGTDEGDQLLKSMEKDLKKMNKCQRIYARVVNGDKVPPEDLLYLERCDPEGFKLALAMRRPNKHPKEWESELDDEDRKELQSGEDMQLCGKDGGGASKGAAGGAL